MNTQRKNIALVTAGGIGARTLQEIPKQFITVNNKPILIYTLEAFQNHPLIDEIAVACLEGWEPILDAYARQFHITKLKTIVVGGKTVLDSIHNVVNALGVDDDSIILMHDGIRPMVSQDIISDCISTCTTKGNAVAIIPTNEVILTTENKDDTSSSNTIDRSCIKRTQTPQAFLLKDLKWMYENATEEQCNTSYVLCDLMVKLGKEIHFAKGSEKNIKITTIEDIEIFNALMNSCKTL